MRAEIFDIVPSMCRQCLAYGGNLVKKIIELTYSPFYICWVNGWCSYPSDSSSVSNFLLSFNTFPPTMTVDDFLLTIDLIISLYLENLTDREAWWVTVWGGHKESNITEQLSTHIFWVTVLIRCVFWNYFLQTVACLLGLLTLPFTEGKLLMLM